MSPSIHFETHMVNGTASFLEYGSDHDYVHFGGRIQPDYPLFLVLRTIIFETPFARLPSGVRKQRFIQVTNTRLLT